MSDKMTGGIIEALAESIEMPESAYEKAEGRYKDLGEWFGRREAKCFPFDPHIYPQGSFRLGTAVRSDEYDLDFGCRLRKGVSRSTHTQKELKSLVGADMEEYRKARGIQSKLEEKHRCWRLRYADELSFHMDAVPSIPQEVQQRQMLREAMVRAGSADLLAKNVTQFAGAITDNTLPNYEILDPNWRVSNSEGYALWFESRMKLAMALLENRARLAKAARVDDLPARKWKSPLQQCVQILKHHRDVMFSDDPDGKPISVIITTLAAEAYQGEQDVAAALERVVTDMSKYVRETNPRVPNPVNPSEDFADKWYAPKYRHLDLERKFWLWLEQARADYRNIAESRDADFLAEQFRTKFASAVDANALKNKLGLGTVQVITGPKSHQIVETPAKPWSLM
jgi:hypothetical protein